MGSRLHLKIPDDNYRTLRARLSARHEKYRAGSTPAPAKNEHERRGTPRSCSFFGETINGAVSSTCYNPFILSTEKSINMTSTSTNTKPVQPWLLTVAYYLTFVIFGLATALEGPSLPTLAKHTFSALESNQFVVCRGRIGLPDRFHYRRPGL